MSSGYDVEFDWANSHGHAARLLIDRVPPGVVVDLGCGYAPHAEILRDHGFTFVGVDIDESGLERLADRGFDTGIVDLADHDGIAAALDAAVDERSVAAVLALDVLEHLPTPHLALAALRRWMVDRGAGILGTSIPNVSYEDIGLKLVAGRWDVTPTGLLDETHLRFFTDTSLTAFLGSVGFVEAHRHDVSAPYSDQYWPADLPSVSAATPLGRLLRSVRSRADDHGRTHQFVRLHRLDPNVAPHPSLTPRSSTLGHDWPGPFLSVLTTGDAVDLGDQTSDDFEIVTPPPGGFGHGALATMLEQVRGRYVAVLGAGDRPEPAWVEQFANASVERPGVILRCAPSSTVDGGARWSEHFEWGAHLTSIASPSGALAFPIDAIRGLRAGGDADGVGPAHSLLLELGPYCGVADTGVAALSVDAGWNDDVSADALAAALARVDRSPWVADAGMAGHLAALTERVRNSERRAAELEVHVAGLEADNRWLNDELGVLPVRVLRRVLRRESGAS